MFSFKKKGSIKNIKNTMDRASRYNPEPIIEHYAEMCIESLRDNTPVDSGKTAASWTYTLQKSSKEKYILCIDNTNVINGVNIALIIEHGHATRYGGWVEGQEYIYNALQPVLDKMASELCAVIYSVK